MSKKRGAPIALLLHPHPQFGGTMNNQIIYNLYYQFLDRGFSVLRFNFRGVGRSQGLFDHGAGEMSDAASALDWAQAMAPEAKTCWVAGVPFRRLDRHAAADAPPLEIEGSSRSRRWRTATTTPSSRRARRRASSSMARTTASSPAKEVDERHSQGGRRRRASRSSMRSSPARTTSSRIASRS